MYVFSKNIYISSLQDIEICLRLQASKLYHIGIRRGISRNSFTDANQFCDWRDYVEFFQNFIHITRNLHVKDELFDIRIGGSIFALDSTTIDLCLSLFPWAQFSKRKGAGKMHTLLDLHGNILTFRIFPTERYMMKMSWTFCLWRQGRFISWIWPIVISNIFIA